MNYRYTNLLRYFVNALKCISPDSKSFQGNSIKLIALQMGPIPPWIPRPAATSLNLISESTFHFHFFSPECQTSRRLRIPDYILSKVVPRVTCKAVKDGGDVLSTWHLHLSSALFPSLLSQLFPLYLLRFWFQQNRPFFIKSSNNTSLRNIM